MWKITLILLLLSVAFPARAGMRAPSCDTLAAFALGMRVDAVEIIFGKPAKTMSVDQFEQAIDIVSVCIDEIESRPPDVPGLTVNERKRPRMVALGFLIEDLRIYRNQRRERERRAAQTSGPVTTQQ